VRVVTDLLPRWGRLALAWAGVLGVAIPGWAVSPAAAASPRGAAAAPAASGAGGRQLWASRYGAPGFVEGSAVAASPTGGAVFVTGVDSPSGSHAAYATIGYDAATGAQLWVSPYDGPVHGTSAASAIKVGPHGARVFVTGETADAQGHPEFATVAYDAGTGTRLWASLHAGSARRGAAAADATAMVISPDGKVLYVTGYGGPAAGGAYDYVTVAYAAATGRQLWSTRYDAGGNDQASAIAIGPGGGVVYVTGRSFAKKTGYDAATVAYRAATGKKLWAARYNGPASQNDYASAITVSPDGTSVYITGGSTGRTSHLDFATVGYRASGRRLWARRYNGPGNLTDSGAGVAVSPNGATVVVTGGSKGKGGTFDSDSATIAYSARTGAPRWTRRHGDPTTEDASTAVVMNPRGGTVYVTGYEDVSKEDGEYATLAYSVSTGTQQWAAGYDGPDGLESEAQALAISPDGNTLYVTGFSDTDNVQAATLAYRT
jgi:outer membrane protein assembly factor BamB